MARLNPTTQRIARLASILIHPAVVMVLAAAVAARGADGAPGTSWQALGFTLVAVAAVMLYSAWQTRSGRWLHIDASQRHERSQLNRFAAWLLLGLAAVLAMTGVDRGIAGALGLSGLIVLVGHLLRGHLKSSLHVAFAVFAACLVWPHATASAGLLVAAVVVAWSRVVLCRHGVAEVVVGAALGAGCGVLFQLAVSPSVSG